MKKIVLAVMTTISGLVMLFSYHTSTQSVATTTPEESDTGNTQSDAGATTTAPSATSAASSPATPTASASSSASASASGSGDGTYTGDAVETRWGTVQVEITVENGKITSADAVQFPNENPKDQQINAYAVPALNAEVVQAQSASIDAVSGATVTSGGYIESLQSAIDAAHLG